MTFLLGRHAMLGQDPPIYFRSTTAVRLPSLAIVQATTLPAVPPPKTMTSYFSAAFMSSPLGDSSGPRRRTLVSCLRNLRNKKRGQTWTDHSIHGRFGPRGEEHTVVDRALCPLCPPFFISQISETGH